MKGSNEDIFINPNSIDIYPCEETDKGSGEGSGAEGSGAEGSGTE